MEASYSVADYMGLFLTYTIGSVVVFGVLCICIGRMVAFKTHRIGLAYMCLIPLVIFMFLMGTHALPILERTGDLLMPSEYEVKRTAGEIESVIPVENVPVYYIDGRICGADYITVDEQQYYVISEGLLKEGMLVELHYAAFENNVILGWNEIEEEQIPQVLEEQSVSAKNKEVLQKDIPQGTKNVALVFRLVGFLGSLGVIAFQYLYHNKLVNYLFSEDAQVRSQIIPNRLAISFTVVPVLLISLLGVSFVIESGEYHAFLILTIGFGVMLFVLLKDQFTYLRVDGQTITLSRLGKEKEYMITDIRALWWKSCRGITGKQLVVVFHDGKSYWFNMDCFRGVQNTYKELKGYIDDQINL